MAIIPYQNWSGEGAAVKLRTPQAPDWTAKYQLAAQERRAREAERARQQGEKEDAENTRKDYYKTVGGLSGDWFEADIPARNALTAKVYEILDKHNGNFTGEAFEKEFYPAVADIKTAQIISKNRKDNVDKIGTRIQEVGIDEYENVDILPDIAQGKHVLKMADGSSLEGDVNKVTDLKSYIDFDTQRELALSKVARRFDENVYMNKQLPEIRKGALTKTPITQPDGSVLTVITEDAAEFSAGLKKTWDGKKSLQKEYETRYAANPRGFGSAYEMYQAAYEPLRGENKTTQKFAPQGTGVKQGDGYTASQKLIFTPATTPSFAQQQVDVVKQAVSDYDAQYAKYAEAQKAAGKTPEAKKSFSIPEIKPPDNALAFELTDTQSNIDRPFKDDAGNDINGKPLWIKDSNGKTRIDILETTKLHPSLPPTLTIKTVPYSETNKAVLNNAYSDPKAGIYFIDEEKKWRDSLPKKSEQNKSGSAQDNPIPITKGMKFEKGKWYKGANGEVKQYQ